MLSREEGGPATDGEVTDDDCLDVSRQLWWSVLSSLVAARRLLLVLIALLALAFLPRLLSHGLSLVAHLPLCRAYKHSAASSGVAKERR